jgi:hypothetical protein
MVLGSCGATMEHYPFTRVYLTRGNAREDKFRWAVWVGRLSWEKIAQLPQGQLKRNRNPLKSVMAKAGLMGPWTARGPDTKVWHSDLSYVFGRRWE